MAKSNNYTFGTSNDANKPISVVNSSNTEVEFTTAEGFHGIRYRDEYVGGPFLVPNGAAAPDQVTYTIGGVATQKWTFDGANTEERLSNDFEIPHDMAIDLVNAGTLKIEWHVHFRPSSSNSGTVKWFLDWSYSPPSGAPIAMTSLSCTQAVNNQQYYHFVCGVELPVPSGGFGIGGIINFNLRRTPSDSGDTYPDDAILIKTALHVPTDGDGSRQRYIK